MLRFVSTGLLLVMFTTLSNGALAGGVFKCRVDGKVSYGAYPCADGKGTELAPPASGQASVDAGRELARQKALLAKFEKARAASEASERRGLVRADPGARSRKQRCDRLRLQHKWLEEDLRKAAGPATEPIRLKLRRQAESLAIECPP